MTAGAVEKGASAPLGATVYPGGVNFSVFAKNADLMELVLFDDENAAQPSRVIPLDAKALIAFRQRRDVVAEAGRLSLNQLLERAKIQWRGVALDRPDWGEHSHSLAFTLRSIKGRFLLHGMLNAYWKPLTFKLPPVPVESQESWRRFIDTALASPDDIQPWDELPSVAQGTYVVQPRSVVLLTRALEQGEGVPHGR